MLEYVEERWHSQDLRTVDKWVRSFFHPRTLKETLAAFEYCRTKKDWFLAACVCGILHHQRPGFLSYPASHMVPYLRSVLFPRKDYPELYSYRPLIDRIRRKVKRAYRRAQIQQAWSPLDYEIHKRDARNLPFTHSSMHLIITSPPYYRALDYARDNRLRLWFLGEHDWHSVNRRLINSEKAYEEQMGDCLREMYRVLKRGRYCVLVVGEVQSNGKTRDTGAVLGTLASQATGGAFHLHCAVEDEMPDIRRSRRGTKTTKVEKILVLEKTR
jgi:hypothetical protein